MSIAGNFQGELAGLFLTGLFPEGISFSGSHPSTPSSLSHRKRPWLTPDDAAGPTRLSSRLPPMRQTEDRAASAVQKVLGGLRGDRTPPASPRSEASPAKRFRDGEPSQKPLCGLDTDVAEADHPLRTCGTPWPDKHSAYAMGNHVRRGVERHRGLEGLALRVINPG